MLPDVGPCIWWEKQYSLKSLKESLTTCSLQMFQETRCLGKAWVRYEEPSGSFLSELWHYDGDHTHADVLQAHRTDAARVPICARL